MSMGSAGTDEKDHHLLVSELQALGVEAKRRHPDVKDVSPYLNTCTDV
jgi:hypothetical protein